MNSSLKPKIMSVFKEGYSLKLFSQDLFAGLIVAILSIPLSLAFAVAAGARPEQGLYTAIVAGLLTSIMGGSRVQIGGPTGAFVILTFTIIQTYGYNGLVIATVMAGCILIAVGFARFGVVIQFIPYPVTVGFTSGIAVVLFVSQIRDFLGLTIASAPVDFIDKIICYGTNISTLNSWAFAIGIMALLIITFWKKVSAKIPGSLVAIIVTTTIVKIFHLPLETIGSRFGAIPMKLPSLTFPTIEWEQIPDLVPSSIAIALLAGIVSLLSAVVSDGMTGRRHRSNIELIAQGAANIGSVLFGGIPSTGAIARTATSIKNGGKTPIAGIVNALAVLTFMFFLGKIIAFIPLATLAAVIIVVAYNMSEWRHFANLFLSPKEDVAVLLTTFFLTVFVDLTTALEVGIILAAFLFIHKTVSVSQADYVKNSLVEEDDQEDNMSISKMTIHPDIEVFEIYGSFFFGAVESFKTALSRINRNPKVLIIRMRSVLMIDASGIRAIMDLNERLKSQGVVLLVSGIHSQPRALFSKTQLLTMIGREHIFSNIYQALAYAEDLVSKN